MGEDATDVVVVTDVPTWQGVRAFLSRHRIFAVALVLAAGVRAVVMIAYQPVEWFNDSYAYVTAAVHLIPETIRPSGYALLLAVLRPLHSFAAVALLQHLLGLATGVLVYTVLRVRGVAAWLATAAALPVLFDAYEVQLEHLVMADTLFMFLVTAAIAVLCVRSRPGWAAAAVAGLLLGTSAIVRTDGRPLLVVAAICLIVMWAGWRQVTALILAGLAPVAGYAAWYHVTRGPVTLTQGDGAFLYSRAMSFADCAKMNPPAALRPLCDPRPAALRLPPGDYIWRPNPLTSYLGSPFASPASKLGEEFALLAVRKQPLDYARAVATDVARAFTWNRSTSYPDAYTARQYQYSTAGEPLPSWAPLANLQAYQAGNLRTQVHRPFSSALVIYQRFVYFRGLLLLLTLLVGAAWVVTGRRRGAPGLLPWCVAVTLIVVPPATAGFSYRYVLAAVPAACVAAGLAGVSARVRRTAPAPQTAGQQAAGPAGPAAGTAVSPPGAGERPGAGDPPADTGLAGPADHAALDAARPG